MVNSSFPPFAFYSNIMSHKVSESDGLWVEAAHSGGSQSLKIHNEIASFNFHDYNPDI